MKILVLDTETSGLFRYDRRADAEGQPRMIQLALGLISYSQAAPPFVAWHDFPIKPDGWAMDDELAAKMGHGMTQEWLLEHGHPVADALDLYESFLAQCDLIVGFNVAFDQKVMRAELRRAGRHDHYAERPEFDVQKAMRPMVAPKGAGKKSGWKLIDCVRFAFKAEPEKPLHSALADAQETARLFDWLRAQGHDTTGTIPPKKLLGEEDDSAKVDTTKARAAVRQEMALERPADGFDTPDFLKN